MTAVGSSLALRVTEAVVAVEGVRGVFPRTVVAAAQLVVPSRRGDSRGAVEVERGVERLDVTARLAIDAASTASEVALAVERAVREAVEGAPFALHLEIVHFA